MPINFASDNTNSDADLPKVIPTQRQIIVPIPEEMRIKLGQYAKHQTSLDTQEIQSDRKTPRSTRTGLGDRAISGRTITNLDSTPIPNSEYLKHQNQEITSYDLIESARKHKPDNLPTIYNQRSETPEILANFKPESSSRKSARKSRRRYLDDSVFNESVKSKEKLDIDDEIKY